MAKKNGSTQPVAQDESNVAVMDVPAQAPIAQTNGRRGRIQHPDVRYVEYKLAGAIPQQLVGKVLIMPETATIAGMTTQVEDGKEEHIAKLAQAQLDIQRQRVARLAATSEEVTAILEGKGEYEPLNEEERIQTALDYVQEAADDYVYGSTTRAQGTGVTAKAKKFDSALEKARQEAANDPELAAKLAAIFGAGFNLNA